MEVAVLDRGAPTFLLTALLLMGVWGLVIAPRLVARATERRERALAELTRRLWGEERAEASRTLVDRDRIMFVEVPGWEQRLDHRLEDGHGVELGAALEEPRPGRLAYNGKRSRLKTVRVVVTDAFGDRELEIVRPSGWRIPPLQVRDGAGAPVGTIARVRRNEFALRDDAGVEIGTIVRRSRRHQVDYEILDAMASRVGTISDLAHISARAAGSATLEPLVKALRASQPSEHVLELHGVPDLTLRKLALAAAASVFLYLQSPLESGGD